MSDLGWAVPRGVAVVGTRVGDFGRPMVAALRSHAVAPVEVVDREALVVKYRKELWYE